MMKIVRGGSAGKEREAKQHELDIKTEYKASLVKGIMEMRITKEQGT